MAILKHISVKNRFYSSAVEYLTCNQIILTLLYSALFIQYGLVGIFIKLAGKIPTAEE